MLTMEKFQGKQKVSILVISSMFFFMPPLLLIQYSYVYIVMDYAQWCYLLDKKLNTSSFHKKLNTSVQYVSENCMMVEYRFINTLNDFLSFILEKTSI